MSTNRFKDRTAVVTGAASGIGLAVAKRLGLEGAHVVLFDINEQPLREVRAEFSKSLGISCEIRCVDVSSEADMMSGFSAIADTRNGLDILVHSAGITGPTGVKITEISVEDYDKVYRINQRSAFLAAKYSLPYMVRQNYGRIVMFASIAGKEGNPGMAPYTSTKAAVIGLVKGLGKEYADSGITVNGIAPAVIRTPMNEKTSPEQLRYMTEKIPMKRLGTVEEAASLAAWICSEEASFSTGFIFDLSGGRATY